jgi:hypothetical protein
MSPTLISAAGAHDIVAMAAKAAGAKYFITSHCTPGEEVCRHRDWTCSSKVEMSPSLQSRNVTFVLESWGVRDNLVVDR